MTRKSRVLVVFAIVAALIGAARQAFAQSDDCMSVFYRTKDAACLDGLVASLDRAPAGVENGAIIGFFAALFDSSPEMRRKLLDAVHSSRAADTYFIALSKAGLTDEARRFASARGLERHRATPSF